MTVDVIHKTSRQINLSSSNECLSSHVRVGGIANIARALRFLSNKIEIGLSYEIGKDFFSEYINEFTRSIHSINRTRVSPFGTSTAVVIEDGTNKFSSFYAKEVKIDFSTQTANWAHISYLDSISNLNHAKNLRIINSVDLCGREITNAKRKEIHEIIKLSEYLIISEDELNSVLKRLKHESIISQIKRLSRLPTKGIIVHSKKLNYLLTKKYFDIQETPVLFDGLKLVGAGDTFLANFIFLYLKHKDEKKAFAECVDNTPKILKRLNE